LAQILPDVDQALSQSRKTDEIASSDVARPRVNWITFHAMICLLLAAGCYAQQRHGEQRCAEDRWR
jgi:hypothetical protein